MGANGYTQVQMGGYGCGRVRWDTRDINSTKTRQAGDIYGVAGQDLGPMVGEISPDIMFWGVCQKMVYMGADGYRAVLMGADGCINKGESKNKAKRAPNGRAGHVFERMLMCKKYYMLPKMIVVLREGQGEEQRANKVRALRFNIFKQRKNSKTNRKVKEEVKTRTHKYGNPRSKMQ